MNKVCKHLQSGYCLDCRLARRESAKKAARTREANGNNWGLSPIFKANQEHASVREWMAAKSEPDVDYVRVRDGLVFSRDKSPVWIVDMDTYLVEELLSLPRLKELIAGRVVIGSGDTPLFHRLSRLTVAPQSAIEEGEVLEEFGLGPGWATRSQ